MRTSGQPVIRPQIRGDSLPATGTASKRSRSLPAIKAIGGGRGSRLVNGTGTGARQPARDRTARVVVADPRPDRGASPGPSRTAGRGSGSYRGGNGPPPEALGELEWVRPKLPAGSVAFNQGPVQLDDMTAGRAVVTGLLAASVDVAVGLLREQREELGVARCSRAAAPAARLPPTHHGEAEESAGRVGAGRSCTQMGRSLPGSCQAPPGLGRAAAMPSGTE